MDAFNLPVLHLSYLFVFLAVFHTVNCDSTTVDELYNEAVKAEKVSTYKLSEAKTSPLKVTEKTKSILDIFCHNAPLEKDLKNMLTSSSMVLVIPSEDFQLYQGCNESMVYKEHKDATQSWLNIIRWKSDYISLPPFNKTCIGVATKSDYSVKFIIKIVDPWLIARLIIGVVLYLSAPRLSKNILFFYGSGVALGVFASLLVVVFILSRFLPKKSTLGLVLLISGWSFSFYLCQYAWTNVQSILEHHYQYVVAYFVTAVAISLIVCYIKGPVTNPKVHNLIQWTIQFIAIVTLYFGTQIPEVSVTFIALLIIHGHFPPFVSHGLKAFWRSRFPPKVRLLTEEEYVRQGNEETRKALEDLREYCRSPDCDAWKTISRLNTPQRFAHWVEGSSHLSDDELMAYDDEPIPASPVYITDDEDEIDFMLNSP